MLHDQATYEQVARLHATCIDQGFLTTLGERFLALLYRAMDESQSNVLIVDVKEGVVMGFVSGGAGLGPIYRALLSHPIKLTIALAPVLLSLRKLRGIFEVLFQGPGSRENTSLPGHELFSIAVAAHARRTGIADRLYADLCDYFYRHGVEAFRIIVGNELSSAHGFYLRMGAKPVGSIRLHRAAASSVYVQSLRD